jgi:hypothetical protein
MTLPLCGNLMCFQKIKTKKMLEYLWMRNALTKFWLQHQNIRLNEDEADLHDGIYIYGLHIDPTKYFLTHVMDKNKK